MKTNNGMKFIKCIYNVSINNKGLDLYTNKKTGASTIRPTSHCSDFPKSKWITFKSLDDAEKWIEGFESDSNVYLHDDASALNRALIHLEIFKQD